MPNSPSTIEPAGPCEYLPGREWQFEYEPVETLTPEEYQSRLDEGWRRFGYVLFRPRCTACSACQGIRVRAAEFKPSRAQRRVRAKNESFTRIEIGAPQLDPPAFDLYLRFHRDREARRGWQHREQEDPFTYFTTFVLNPFPTEEWRYYRDDRLVGVGIVDTLPLGLSAVYFYHEPELDRLSLGTWNVLSVIARANALGLPFAYLGYYVPGCRSMEYKGRFRPHELLPRDGVWQQTPE